MSTLSGCGGLLGDSSSTSESQGGASVGGAGAAAGGASNASGCVIAGGSSAGDTSTGGAFPPAIEVCYLLDRNCRDVVHMTADIRTVNMLLVVDASASMNDQYQATDNASRWSLLMNSLSSTLVETGNDINFGLEIFPYEASAIDTNATDPAVACQLATGAAAIQRDILSGQSNVQNILELLLPHVPAGYSPASRALEQAYTYFTEGSGKDLEGSHSVIFATTGGTDCNFNLGCDINTCVPNLDKSCPQGDGGINCCSNAGYLCSDHSAVTATITKLASAGIKTYVVGMPAGYDEFQILNTFATAGQATNPSGAQGELFYWVGEGKTGADDLLDAFSGITTQLIKQCDFPLNGAPVDPNDVWVQFDCRVVPQDTSGSPTTGDGWALDWTREPPHLVVGGAVCDTLMAVGTVNADIAYNCHLGLQ